MNRWLRKTALALCVGLGVGAVPTVANMAAAIGPQFSRPAADVIDGEWTPSVGADLYSTLDEAVRNDADYVRSAGPPNGNEAEVALSDVTDPAIDTGHFLRVVHSTGGTGTWNYFITVSLMQGTNVIAVRTDQVNQGSVWEQLDISLTTGEVSSITDYSDLRVKLDATPWTGTGNRTLRVSWVELEVPEVAPPPPPACEELVEAPSETHTADLIVNSGEKLCFETGAKLIMDNSSLLVKGTLEMRPGKGDIEFRNITESGFVGGGMGSEDPSAPCVTGGTFPCLETDPGLWVMGAGKLDIQGTPKTSWTHNPATATGWSSSDEMKSTPVAPGEFKVFPAYTYDPQNIAPAPSTETPFGTRIGEVMNLTRDVRITSELWDIPGDSPDVGMQGKAHIFIRSTVPQTIKFAEMSNLGPRKLKGTQVQKILGRWALHLHHSEEGSVGTVIEGNVVRDGGGHGIVPHASDGVLVKQNVAYNITEDPYWWDAFCAVEPCQQGGDPLTVSDSIQYIENLGAKSSSPVSPDNSGMFFAKATNSVMHGNVMVGVVGGESSDPSGYVWNTGGSHAGWDTEDNVAHNNNVYGGWLYGNPSNPDPLDGFDVYNNGKAAWFHGSYENPHIYHELTGSGSPHGLEVQAVSRPGGNSPRLQFIDMRMHGTVEALLFRGHVTDATNFGLFLRCDLHGPVKVRIKESGNFTERGWFDLVDCTADDTRDLEPADFVVDFMRPDSRYRLQQPDGDAWEIFPDGHYESIPEFYPYE